MHFPFGRMRDVVLPGIVFIVAGRARLAYEHISIQCVWCTMYIYAINIVYRKIITSECSNC